MHRLVLAVCTFAAVALGAAQEAGPQSKAAEVAPSAKEAKALPVGSAAPEALLKDAAGKEVRLSTVIARGPIVLTFYRGGWCPFCVKQLTEWQDRIEDLKKAGGTLVAVTMEPPSAAAAMASKHELGFVILSDFAGEAMRRYRVGYALDEAAQKKYKGYGVDLSKGNANGKWEMPNPATFVIDRQGKIAYVFNEADYTKRANVDEVLAAVRKSAAPAGTEPPR